MHQIRIFQQHHVAMIFIGTLLLLAANTVSAFCGGHQTANQSMGSTILPSQKSESKSELNARSSDRRSTSATVKPNSGVTASLISKLAIIALKLRLPEKNCTVDCDVTATSSDLLTKGQVGPVTVRGKGWRSPLGLTCRVIEATVQECELDMASIFSRRKLILTTPALGDAMIAFNDVDFGNFITHPFIKSLSSFDASSNGEVKFLKDGVIIDSEYRGGSAFFNVSYSGKIWRCTLSRAESGGAIIEIPRGEDDIVASKLSKYLSTFFNELVFELDGTFLSFKDMIITTKGKSPILMMALFITVKKFPSPGLAF